VRAALKLMMIAGAFALAGIHAASHADYPERPVRTIVPFTPGGNADVTARLIARALTEELGHAFIVENKGGAGGLIGGAVVTQATPDGYTVMFGTGAPIFASSVLAGDKAPYTLKDLQPIGRVSTVPLLLVVNKNSPFHTFAQFEAAAKARPGQLKIGHAGNGTTNHVSVLQLQKAMNTKFIIAPYKGSAPSLQDVMTGQLDMASAEATACLQFVTSGQLRALAIIGEKRLAVLPDVPTVQELGLKGVDVTTFAGMLVPLKTPKPVVARLSDALMQAMAKPALQQRLIQLGATPAPLAPQAFSQFLSGEQTTYERLVKEGLLTIE
jgi:tripartite-type tricarboxylate transporter receptor subunit TctC